MKKMKDLSRFTPVFLLVTITLCTVFPASAQRGRRQNVTQEVKKASPAVPVTAGLKFKAIGPAAYSGRIADFAVNPENPSEYYVGTASGGIWKTENRGTTFRPVFDNQSVYSIGAMAIDPCNPNIVWAGTGENNSQRNLAYGDGIYKTLDGGKSWQNMGLNKSEHIGKIIIDPDNTSVVYVAAQGPVWGPGGDRGLYKTSDGGKTWNQILEVGEYTGISDIEMDPRDHNILYASAHQRERRVYSKINGGPESALYKSEDGGASWRKLTKGLPSGDVGRIGLTLSSANPDIIYAVIELPGNKGGFYRSTNMGESWTRMSDMVPGSPQYYMEIYADPDDPDRVISMDVRNMVTEDGGKTWAPLGENQKHVDNHALWIDPDNTNYYLMGCDGGVYVSWDRGENWIFQSNLPITQFYHARLDNALPFYNIYGGAQDNGSWFGPSRTLRRSIVNSDWTYTIGGDGFLSIPDPEIPGLLYAESQYCGFRRYDSRTGNSVSIKPQPVKDETYRFNWNTPYFISPFNSSTLYVAANKVFKSTDRGDSWKEISPDLTRQIDVNTLPMMGKIWPPEAIAKSMSTSPFGNIFALVESPLKQGMIYAGTDDGLVWLTEDDGGTWQKYSSFAGVPDMTFVNYILPSQHDVNTVYACFDGRKNASDFTPYLLKSTDKGKSWTSIASNLPSGTVYVIQEDYVDPNILFIGTEWGVWVTIDGGMKWNQIKSGIPTIMVKDLAIQKRENDLVAATFGRGFYILEDYSYLRELNNDVTANDAHIFNIKDGLLYYPASNHNGQGGLEFKAPNPNPNVTIRYYVKEGYKTLRQKRMAAQKAAEKAGREIYYPTPDELEAEAKEEAAKLIFTISDNENQIIRKIEQPLRKGIGSVNWDMRYLQRRGPAVPPGEYVIKMEKYVNGTFTTLVDRALFKVRTLDNNPLGTPDYKAKFEFLKKATDLNKKISEVYSYISDLSSEINKVKSDLATTPKNTNDVLPDANDLIRKLDKLSVKISGRNSLGARANSTSPSLMNRARFAMSANASSESDITGSQIEQFNIANDKLIDLMENLGEILSSDLPAFTSKLSEVGINKKWPVSHLF